MSFGYGISDVVAIGGLAYKVVQNSRKACGEHDELTREVSAFHVVLQRLEIEIARPSSPLTQPDKAGHGQELTGLVRDSRKVLQVLDDILNQYNSLNNSERSAKKLWKKFRFGNGEMADVGDYRAKLVFFTTAISLHLNLATVGTVGRVEQKMIDDGGLLREMKISIDSITANFISKGNHEGSVLTTYADDEKAVWREFRRELINEGFLSTDLKKNMPLIMAYVQELGKRGIFDDEDETMPQEVLAERKQHDLAQKGDHYEFNDNPEYVSTKDGKNKSQRGQSKPIVIPPAVNHCMASPSSQKALPIRIPTRAYVESGSDSAPDSDKLATDGSANDPALSECADASYAIPIASSSSKVKPMLKSLQQTKEELDQVDDYGSGANLKSPYQESELSEFNVSQLPWRYGEREHPNKSRRATIDSDSISGQDRQTAWCIFCSNYVRHRSTIKMLCGDYACRPCFKTRLTDDVYDSSQWENRDCLCGSKIIQYHPSSLQNLPLLDAIDRCVRATDMYQEFLATKQFLRPCNDPTCMESETFVISIPKLDVIDRFFAKWAPNLATFVPQRSICQRCKSQNCSICNAKWRNYHGCGYIWQMLDDLPTWPWNSRPVEPLKLHDPTDTKFTTNRKILLAAREPSVESLFTTEDTGQDEETIDHWRAIARRRMSKYTEDKNCSGLADWDR